MVSELGPCHLYQPRKADVYGALDLEHVWCPVMVERLFLAVPRGCLRFVIVVFPDHTH